jgi:hypothetical protein
MTVHDIGVQLPCSLLSNGYHVVCSPIITVLSALQACTCCLLPKVMLHASPESLNRRNSLKRFTVCSLAKLMRLLHVVVDYLVLQGVPCSTW